MKTIELKNNIHNLIDSINNKNLLLNLYQILKNRTNKDGDLWKRLTIEEKEELISAFEESKDDYNLISNEEMEKKLKKWL